MSKFEILNDVENQHVVKINRKKKSCDVTNNKDRVAEKKFANSQLNGRRGVLQPVNNGIRQQAKRMKLSSEEIKIEEIAREIVSLDDSFKENIEDQIYDEILNIEKSEEELSKKEESNRKYPKKLLLVAEYRKDIRRYLQELERSYPIPKNKYMLKQSDLSWSTRSILVDWLASVAEEYKLCHETFHLSVNYVDRFLNHFAVVRTKFQLVGAAAMLLAGKMEEIYPIDVTEWSYLTGDAFTPRQIKKMEQLLLKILNFRMQPPTICTFIEHFCYEHDLDVKIMNLAMYISELVLLEGDEYLNHLPSKLAASSIALARYTLSKESLWPKKFKDHCGYSVHQLSPVVQKQQETFIDSPHKAQQAIQTKYKSDKYHRVALFKPRKLVLEEFEDES